MNIDSIHNGYVLDHIQAGASMEIYRLLGLDKLDCSVAIIKNAKSTKLGRKDIIKIDEFIDLDLDVLGYVDPDITVSIIKDGVFITHPLDNLILPGTERKHMLAYCHALGIPVEERAFTPAEMMAADEIIMSSTSHPSMRVMEVDKTPAGMKDPALVKKLRDMYMEDIEKLR